MNDRSIGRALAALISTGVVACGGDDEEGGTGALSVLLEAEDVIIEGLEPGEEAENIRDGWTVTFDKYIVVIGDIDVHFQTDESIEAEAPETFVVDLKQIPQAGLGLWELDGLRAGRWHFNYAIGGAGDGASRHESVSQDDFDLMAGADLTYLVEGTLTRDDGQSCPPALFAEAPTDASADGENAGGDPCYDNAEITFSLGAAAETTFGMCEIDGLAGFSVPSGGTQTVAATIHGDHLFFNGFPESDESGTLRLVQWMADADLNIDGTVTEAELAGITLADLPEIDDRFQLGSPPIEIETVWDYIVAQLKTQGHFQGEGECEVDGVSHEHE
ncbi:MAG TPA: hypothetical protein VF989_07995 [Polyangiaceae bacterium]